ncbi:MAG: glutathione S-transferase family protein [Gammaproteobacteria bacterium]|nr:glutathione S-transferase family protein [Gammaproteobacteria bacterium]NNJ78784.1 glutathione S-transferase family protein [Xanthomonadales bacterium]
MITLFWCPQTRASRVLWMLEELGEAFEVRLADVRNPDSLDDDFREASPMGKVPALLDDAAGGAVKMADSAPICLYLADRYASGRLAPAADDPARGRFLFWMFFTPGAIEPAMMEKFVGFEVNPGSCGWGNYEKMIETLSAGVAEGPWIMGDRFTAADVLLGSSVFFMKQFGLLAEGSALEPYLERCQARPAYQAAMSRETD